jgi:hypothetical protein
VGLRLRKADLEILALVNTEIHSGAIDWDKEYKQWDSFYRRVLASQKPKDKTASSLSVRAAIDIFRGVLGRRLIVPAGSPPPSWYITLQNRINASGLTPALAKAAAEMAGASWKGAIKAESIIRQADALLSEGHVETLSRSLPEEAKDMDEL